jgi:hypothetical protein
MILAVHRFTWVLSYSVTSFDHRLDGRQPPEFIIDRQHHSPVPPRRQQALRLLPLPMGVYPFPDSEVLGYSCVSGCWVGMALAPE